MIKTFVSALALGLTLALPLAAQSSGVSPATGEIMTGWQQADGTRIAAIRIKLAPGWKTYWRSPGDAGIPPHFDWSGSTNLRGVGITWPAPKVYPQNGMQTIGYKDELVLPITISARNPGKPVRLRAALDIGVCKDICVPFQISLKATLEGAVTTPTPAIAAALAARPYSAKEAGVRSTTCALRATTNGFEIEARMNMPAMGGNEVVVIEPGDPALWMSQTQVHRSGGHLVATGTLDAGGTQAIALDRSAITITVLGKNQAVEIKGCTPK
ncbi:MAG: protein-disulfide reductase DsbD domain-containing protein [Sulfitobacter sp.]